jgi:hypothetical protein
VDHLAHEAVHEVVAGGSWVESVRGNTAIGKGAFGGPNRHQPRAAAAMMQSQRVVFRFAQVILVQPRPEPASFGSHDGNLRPSSSLPSTCCSTTKRKTRPKRSLLAKPARTRSSWRRSACNSDSTVGIGSRISNVISAGLVYETPLRHPRACLAVRRSALLHLRSTNRRLDSRRAKRPLSPAYVREGDWFANRGGLEGTDEQN